MKIEIWSDIACPFCYIGKRRLEQALDSFPEKNAIEIEFKSFQLDPEFQSGDKTISVYEYLAQKKGISIDQSRELHKQVEEMAANTGLNYDFGKTIVANTRKSHRLLHYAHQQKKGNELKEALFKAYFIDGKNLNADEVLCEVAVSCDLPVSEVNAVLNSDQYNEAVYLDIQEAANIGVNGVPFFVFNQRYALSGAQPVHVFRQAIDRSFQEWKDEQLTK